MNGTASHSRLLSKKKSHLEMEIFQLILDIDFIINIKDYF